MSMPTDIDQYSRYIYMERPEMEAENLSPLIIERVKRLRAIFSYWQEFPTKTTREIVTHDMQLHKIKISQAYDDVHLCQLLLGNVHQATKEFYRWKINVDLDEDIRKARIKGDFRAVAALEAVRVKNNRTDKDDEPELEFDKIIPQNFVPTDDPSVIGIKKIPGLRDRIRRLEKKYSNGTIEDAEYVEVKDDEESNDGTKRGE